MKNAFFVLGLASMVFVSCKKDKDNEDVVLSDADIPAQIKNYVTLHFASGSINKAVKDKEPNSITYDVYLSNGTELEFDQNFNIIDIDGSAKLPDSVIPEKILNYVTEKYPGNYITGWELEANYQQVQLNNNVELEFDTEGNFLRIDND